MDNSKKIVIKIGSAMVFDYEKNDVRKHWMETVASDIADLIAENKEVIMVSSGAIALGRKFLKTQGKLTLAEEQAASACGQVLLINAWQECFYKYGHRVGQLLITKDTSDNLRRYLNACDTLNTLLKHEIIPIINENDTVNTEEIKFGDNDMLAAKVAQMSGADTLFLLSDIDGLYTEDPNKNPDARFIEEVKEITEDIEKMAGTSNSKVGTGGMITKLNAAKVAYNSGCNTIISNGKKDHPIKNLDKCTRFISNRTPKTAKEHWINDVLEPKGVITIYDSEIEGIQNGLNISHAGVIKIKGDFNRGDLVLLQNKKGKTIGKGLSAYNSKEAQKVLGKKEEEVDEILGYEARKALIYRENLIVTN